MICTELELQSECAVTWVFTCLQEHAAALASLQERLEQAYQDMSDMQFNTDQDKAQTDAQLQMLTQAKGALEQQLQVGS